MYKGIFFFFFCLSDLYNMTILGEIYIFICNKIFYEKYRLFSEWEPKFSNWQPLSTHKALGPLRKVLGRSRVILRIDDVR